MHEAGSSLLHRIVGGPVPLRQDSDTGRAGLIVAYAADTITRTAPTPVVDIEVVVAGRARTLLLKLDGHSRWGSIKGRTGLALLASIADQVSSRTTVVESTSGNLGVALAGICRDLGIPFTAVVDSHLPPHLSARIAAYGARTVDVESVDDGLHLHRRIARVQEILDEDADARWTNQYENPANVGVHRWWTGPELSRQLPPQVRALFAPVSTGGSFVGLREHLSTHRPEVECTAVDVQGSTIFGGKLGHRLLTGIGASKPSVFIGERTPPRHVTVSDTEAIATCRTLRRDVGIGIGGSSGATLAGCLHYLSERPDLTHVVCLCPDTAVNYAETLYDDEWLRQAGIELPLRRPSIGGHDIHFADRRSSGELVHPPRVPR